jgi:hypothetical protein
MQPFQQEVSIEDEQSRTIDVPLSPIALGAVVKPPSYKGFYGRFSTPIWIGFGGSYAPPANLKGSTIDDPMLGLNIKLALGGAFGWFRIEGVAMAMMGGRFTGGFKDQNGQQQISDNYPMLSGFFGAGARATSETRVIRVTGGLALGAGPHQVLGGQPIQATACNTSNSSQQPSYCHGPDAQTSPGYTAFAMTGDVGILLGGGASPAAKFWIGIDWYVDFPPDIVVGPLTKVPDQFLTNGGATMMHGPQFYIGPSLGVDFGH